MREARNRTNMESGGPVPTPRRHRPRLTPAGIHFTVIAVLTGFASIALANNLLFLVFGLVTGLFVVSAVAAGSTLRRISVVRRLPHPIFAQQRFRVRLDVGNGHPFWPLFHVELEELDVGRAGPRALRALAARVASRGSAEAIYTARLPESGWTAFSAIRVTTEFPFGLLRWSRDLPLPASVLVLPRLGRVSPRLIEERFSPSTSAVYSGLGRRGDDEFAGLKEFRPGDDPRLIHWRSSARHPGRLLVREMESVSLERVVIALDLRIIARREKLRRRLLETAVSFAATLAGELVARGHPVAVWTFRPGLEEIEARPGDGSLYGLFEGLALLVTDAPGRIEDHLDRAGPAFFQQNRVVLVGRGAHRIAASRSWGSLVTPVDPGRPDFARLFRRSA